MLSHQVEDGGVLDTKRFQFNISELESNANDLNTKFKLALAHLEEEQD